jgi:hypothetical protein
LEVTPETCTDVFAVAGSSFAEISINVIGFDDVDRLVFMIRSVRCVLLIHVRAVKVLENTLLYSLVKFCNGDVSSGLAIDCLP